uniref:LIM zinc-binding domain-containing protein n=1 Tax=Rhodosorus marinus TaxID=101924 RepID=A0A7S3AAP4_9RHOD|mmetsp:Transcript_9507/g.41091  ORF Transcript_9507/g.41091 Transcript_9507/m.41091 type:complete len:578 (+) Transcript_9507:386-2119(+)
MAVYTKSSTYSLTPLVKVGFTGELHHCHNGTVLSRRWRIDRDGAISDLESHKFLGIVEGDKVDLVQQRNPWEITVLMDGQLVLKKESKNLCATRSGELKLVEHCRAWEKFRLKDVSIAGMPDRPVDAKVGALSVLLSIECVFRLRSVHGGILLSGNRCNGKEEDASRFVLFRTGKRLDVDRYQLLVANPKDVEFLTGSTLSIKLRVGKWNMAQVAILATDDKFPSGRYLRAERSGELTDREGEISDWETFVVEVTEQSANAGLKEIAEKQEKLIHAAEAAAALKVKTARVSKGSSISGKEAEKKATKPANQAAANKAGFNYGAALQGASASGATAASQKVNGSAVKAASNGGKSADQKPTGARGSAVAPKGGARRSSKKKSSKKKKKGAPGSAPGPAAAKVAAKPAGPGQTSSAADKKKLDEVIVDNGDEDEEVAKAYKLPDPCYACGRELEGTITKAMGKRFHASCFVCSMCRNPLTGGTFHENAGKALCSNCYKNKVAPRCAACGEGILGTVTTALNRTWHPMCFTCRRCGQAITAEKFWVLPHKPNEPFCGNCYSVKNVDMPKFTMARVGTPLR